MMNVNKIGKTVFRLRGGIWTVFFLIVLFFSRPLGSRAIAGLLFVVAGQVLRLWACGCVVKYRGEQLQAFRLTTWGPYSLVRNPLYVGNGLIGLGWSLMAGWGVMVFFLVLFFIVYNLIIVPTEEAFLENKFGEKYREYKKRTGRFIPKTLPGKYLKGPFDSSIVCKSETHSILVTLVGTVLIMSRIWW